MNSTQETSTLRRKWGSFQQNKRRSTETAWLTCQRRKVGDCTLRANEGNNSFMTHMEYFQIRSRKQWTGARQRTSPRLRLVRLAPTLRGEFVMNADLWEATATCAESWYPNAVIQRGEMSHYTYIYIAERSRRNIEKCHRQEKIACFVLSLFSLESTFYPPVTTTAHKLRRKCARSTAVNMTFTFTFKILDSPKPRDMLG